ncbi:formyltransferase family protein [Pseudomonas alcaligenes]|uniref:formyltransferase family protein n=1 Tax=Aquipseudomonas alcaligenes TaxID=43263 RepID=UPI002E7AC94F|nr:formyltransferase family protein [Pseudomonas alcaligenes]MEE1950840.1 formyltransferase family protein [Pseudomonas alcaligenes]
MDHEVGFRLLEKMIECAAEGRIAIAAVVTTSENGQQWWPGVEGLCRDHAIPFHRYSSLTSDITRLGAVDWFFLLSWKHVLPENLVNYPANGTINLHYSLLPDFRGVYPVNWSLIDGWKETGVTFHRVVKEIDAGAILLQGRISILASDTARSLQLRLDDLACELFDQLLHDVAGGEVPSGYVVAQAGSYKSGASFKAVCCLDRDKVYRAGELIDLLRGMSFRPESRNLYFIDEGSGRRVYLRLELFEDE